MFIKVVNWCSHSILREGQEPTFYLEKDNWTDNYFKTQYHLHLSGKLTDDGEPVWIGEVKILRKGQRKEDRALLETGKLDFPDYRFCSIGQSLDYYERIAQLDTDLRYEILTALRDIIIFPEIKKEFEKEEGLQISLLRSLDKDDDIFSLAPVIVSREFNSLPIPDLLFKFQMPGMEEPVVFEFDSPEYGYHDTNEVPTRVSVITGGNDSGKSELLAKLASIAYASNDDRDHLLDVGVLEPNGLGFTKIICISYRATNSFHVPGIYLHKKEQIVKEINKGVGRFVYFGIHDLSKEFEESLKLLTIDTDGRIWEQDSSDGVQKITFPKSSEELSAEFILALETIEGNSDKQDLLEKSFQFLQEEPALQFIGDLVFTNLTENALEEFFRNLTNGQQFVFHAIANLILKIVPRSLVLFDAPETDLDPSLLAVLMKSIRHIVDIENALMIVATQSPKILQETQRKNVSIFRREGEYIKISSPEIETFGETIEAISAHVLGFSSDIHPLST